MFHVPPRDGLTQYVVGLPFCSRGQLLMLIRKNRPAWQVGMLNGIGGKVERGEAPLAAMMREAEEEAGIVWGGWQDVCHLRGDTWCVDFYAQFDDRNILLQSRTDEKLYPVAWFSSLAEPSLIPNLRVIIPLALDRTGIHRPVVLFDGQSKET